MAKVEIKAGSTNRTIDVFIPDSSSSVGAGLTGLVYNSAGLTCYYRKGATGSSTVLTLKTLATIGTAHDDGGFKEIDATNQKGMYRLDLSDTMVATAGMLSGMLRGATNMADTPFEIEVVEADKYDAVRQGMTALPNADADAAGGLPISDLGGLDLDGRLDADVSSRMATYTQPTGFLAATFPTGTVANTTNITAGTITTSTNLTNLPTMPTDWVTNTGLAASAVAEIQSGLATPTNITAGTITTATNLTNLPAIPANWLTAAGTAADFTTEIQAGLATQASVDTIDGIVDAILLDTAEIGAAGAGLTALATQASVDTIDGIVDSILVDTAVIGVAGAGLTALATQASVDTIDGIVDAILVDTTAIEVDTTAIEVDTQDIQSRLPAALVSGRMNSNVAAVSDSTVGVAGFQKATSSIIRGTVGVGSTTTSIVTSSMSPASTVADQFNGKIVTFDGDTSTTALQGQSTSVTSHTAGGVITVPATELTTAPLTGDTFTIE